MRRIDFQSVAERLLKHKLQLPSDDIAVLNQQREHRAGVTECG